MPTELSRLLILGTGRRWLLFPLCGRFISGECPLGVRFVGSFVDLRDSLDIGVAMTGLCSPETESGSHFFTLHCIAWATLTFSFKIFIFAFCIRSIEWRPAVALLFGYCYNTYYPKYLAFSPRYIFAKAKINFITLFFVFIYSPPTFTRIICLALCPSLSSLPLLPGNKLWFAMLRYCHYIWPTCWSCSHVPADNVPPLHIGCDTVFTHLPFQLSKLSGNYVYHLIYYWNILYFTHKKCGNI